MTGTLPGSIGNLNKLTSLILIGCGFSGPIPPSIGSLQSLVNLSLNSNNFMGEIPPTIGRLSNLYWLDLSDNKLNGSLPVSIGSTPGLDMLVGTEHFHLGSNQFSGPIPPKLFSSNMKLEHLLLENNQITGSIPSTLGLVKSLEILRLDRNYLNGLIPKNLNNLTSLQELYLSNNMFVGSLPDLTGLNLLSYLNMSNNLFDPTDVPSWLSSLMSLTSLAMDKTQIRGKLPDTLFSLSQLQTVSMKNNQINDTLNLGPNYNGQLQLINLENNNIKSIQGAGPNLKIILVGNPRCRDGGSADYCSIPQPSNPNDSVTQPNCTDPQCTSDKVSSPNCKCANPYTGTIFFRSPSFSNFGNFTTFSSLRDKLMSMFQYPGSPVDSITVTNPLRNLDNYLLLTLNFFPSGQDVFNRSEVSEITFILSNQYFEPPPGFGPYHFIGNEYQYFPARPHNPVSMGVIVGPAVGGIFLVLLLVIAVVYACRWKRKAETAVEENDAFTTWDINLNSSSVPRLKGARNFTFEELQRATNNFTETNVLGNGGYGKVYRGNLANGQLVVIK